MSCCCSPLGPGGGGGGAVTSVFGRVGAVVATAGDYDSDQINNASTVVGASVSDALDTLAAAIGGTVPVGRTLTTTSPLRIDGGGSADLSANRTLSVLAVSNTTPGVAPQHAGAADVGKALIATATASAWGTDFDGQTLTTTGGYVSNSATPVLRLGLAAGSGAGSAAATGVIRITGGGNFLSGRNAGDSGDVVLANWDGTNLRFGQTTSPLGGAVLISNSEVQLRNGTNYSLKTTATAVQMNSTITAVEGEGAIAYRSVLRSGAGITGFNTTFNGGDVSAASSTGGTGLFRGGDGGAGTGGPVTMRPGSGTTAQGLGNLQSGAGTVRLAWNSTGLGLYTATPVAQAARVGQAVDSTTGTPSGTLTFVDVTTAAVADPVKINNNFATLVASMWNPLELALHNLGATA